MRVAVVDDDNEVVNFVKDIMHKQGHLCSRFTTGMSFLAALRRDAFDLVLLDWFLPDISGLELLKQITASIGNAMGIIILTNQADKNAVSEALLAGADDYIVKPEIPAVIIARAEAVLRRLNPAGDVNRFMKFDDYTFDRLTETVSFSERSVSLSSKEFALALLMFDNIHRPLSRGYIFQTLWHSDPNLSTRTLDMHVSRIRTKLELRPENGFRIAALSGYGYRLERFLPEPTTEHVLTR